MLHLRALLLLALPVPVLAQEAESPLTVGPMIRSAKIGIFCAPEIFETTPAPDTIAGTTNVVVDEVPFLSDSHIVPAVLDVGFGIKSYAKGDVELTGVTVIVTHPPVGPDGVQRESYQTTIFSSRVSQTLFQFDYEYELVTGPWTLEAIHQGETLFSATFEVVEPGMVPELAEACNYASLLS
ncbi:DUF3859 domain-containing protein [Pelagovum pacificum]|nr:DUF3859 domain-containing protein [Pelagovum pacificum]QQA42309.1 DUF3859 domain-containing protein [Pelagovum pacificum]